MPPRGFHISHPRVYPSSGCLAEYPLSSYTMKALIALHENGTPFEFRMLDPDRPKNAAKLAWRWPITKFPLLVDGDTTVFEAPASIKHLAASHQTSPRRIWPPRIVSGASRTQPPAPRASAEEWWKHPASPTIAGARNSGTAPMRPGSISRADATPVCPEWHRHGGIPGLATSNYQDRKLRSGLRSCARTFDTGLLAFLKHRLVQRHRPPSPEDGVEVRQRRKRGPDKRCDPTGGVGWTGVLARYKNRLRFCR